MIYFLRRADGKGPVKIGCSSCPEARRKQIGINLKLDLEIIAEAPGSYREEGRLHRQFAADAIGREWFEPSPAVMAAVALAARTGKLPPPATEDREIVFARRYLNGETLEEIAGDFGLTRERVRQILRACGVPSLGHRKPTPRPVTDAEREISAHYAAGETSPKDICAQYGLAPHQLTLILRRTNTPRFGAGYFNRRVDHDARLMQAADLYRAGLPVREIAAEIGLAAPEHVYIYLHRAGVSPSRLTNHQARVQGKEDAILAAYSAGATQSELGDRFGVSHATIATLLRQRGALRSREQTEAIRIAAVRRANSLRCRSSESIAA